MLKALTIEDNEKFLRQISKEVEFSDNELKQDIENIKEFCLNSPVFAMAAVQLGIAKRIVYIKSTTCDANKNIDSEQILMINPKILSKKGRTEYWEACASCLDNTALVERPYEILVEYQNEKGEKKTQLFEGFASTVISHELDHLDGIFHMDRAKKILVMTQEERKEFRKTHPYKIISKTESFENLSFEK